MADNDGDTSTLNMLENDALIPCAIDNHQGESNFVASIVVADNVPTLGETAHVFRVGNIPWKIHLIPVGTEVFFQVVITAEELNLARNWGIQAIVTLDFASQRPEGTPIQKVFDGDFGHQGFTRSVFLSRAEMDSLMVDGWSTQSEAAYSLQIGAHVIIRKSFGLRHRSCFSYDFTQPNTLTNLILTLEDKQVFVNVQYLAHYSSFFHGYLCNDRLKDEKLDSKMGLPTLALPSVSYHYFIELLKIIYPTQAKVTGENVEGLLEVANFILCEIVLIKCEEFLKSDDPFAVNLGIYTKLQWSFKYLMSSLQEQCLGQLTSSAAIAPLINDPVYQTMSKDVIKALLDRMMALRLAELSPQTG